MPELIHNDNSSHSASEMFPFFRKFSIQESKLRAIRSLIHDLGNVMVGLYSFEDVLDEGMIDESYQDDADLFKESLKRGQEIIRSITELNAVDSSSYVLWDFKEWLFQELTFFNAVLPRDCFLKVKGKESISLRFDSRLMREVLMVLFSNTYVSCCSAGCFELTWKRSVDGKNLDIIIVLPIGTNLDLSFFNLNEENLCLWGKVSDDSRYFAFFYLQEQIRQFGGTFSFTQTEEGGNLIISLPL